MPDASAPAAFTHAPSDKVKAGVGSGLSVAAIAAAMASAALMSDEGERHVDYLDLAKVPTACFGHTGIDVHIGRHRTPVECRALLARNVAIRQAGVAACVPALRTRPCQWAALTRMAYKTGVPGATPCCGGTRRRRTA